jgi:hypothetical protein
MAETPDPNAGGNDVRQLRDALARRDERIAALEESNNTYRNAALAGVAHQAGFDPQAGPVKLVMEKFEADLTPDKLTPKAFQEFAGEWGINPTPATPATNTPPANDGGTPPTPGTTPDPTAQQQTQTTQQFVQGLQSPADQLAAAANANAHLVADPSSTDAQIAAAQSEGRWGDSFALKVASATAPPDGFGVQQGQVNPSSGLPTHTPPQ